MTGPQCRTPECRRQSRPGGTLCHACYQREYRAQPGNAEKHRAKVADYQRNNRERVRQWRENNKARREGRPPRDMRTVPPRRAREPRLDPLELPAIAQIPPRPRELQRILEDAQLAGWRTAIDARNRPMQWKPTRSDAA